MIDHSKKVYLSGLSTLNIKKKISTREYLEYRSKADNHQPEEVLSLFKAYGFDKRNNQHQISEKQHHYEVTISEENSIDCLSKVAESAIGNTDQSKFLQLILVHDTTPIPESITAVMKLKQRLGLKKAISYSLSDRGYAIAPGAIDISTPFLEESSTNLIVCGDFLHAPQQRCLHTAYPKGDAYAGFKVTTEDGDYEVISYFSDTWSAATNNIYTLSEKDYLQLEVDWSERFKKSIGNCFKNGLLTEDSGQTYIILQNISERFFNEFEKTSFNNLIYRRKYSAHVNLGSSDPFYTLQELDQKNQLNAGDRILLGFAGPLGALGYILLQKKKGNEVI
ncbi:hypothetical protein ACQKJC_12920 [Priestia koreensis]|uniref:hypothetical protein n=1 Tax=Priestia koreensis TaxID=284581 RepID=UPI003D087D0B